MASKEVMLAADADFIKVTVFNFIFRRFMLRGCLQQSLVLSGSQAGAETSLAVQLYSHSLH